jgi:uncharacterized protein (TIGR02391 family)
MVRSVKNFPQQFDHSTLDGIASVLADTELGLSKSEIDKIGLRSGLPNIESVMGYSKKNRLADIFAKSQRNRQNNQAIVNFVILACKPSRFLGKNSEYESLRVRLNQVLSFMGIAIDARGQFVTVVQATTITEAERRANELRKDLIGRNAHPDVLLYCRAELLDEDYFHAVLEATKGLSYRIKKLTGNDIDGQQLIDRAFGGDLPAWVINDFACESQRMEQKGFVGVCKGIIAMFRNPLAHEPRAYWHMTEQDAADVLSFLSLIHRRLDRMRMPASTTV